MWFQKNKALLNTHQLADVLLEEIEKSYLEEQAKSQDKLKGKSIKDIGGKIMATHGVTNEELRAAQLFLFENGWYEGSVDPEGKKPIAWPTSAGFVHLIELRARRLAEQRQDAHNNKTYWFSGISIFISLVALVISALAYFHSHASAVVVPPNPISQSNSMQLQPGKAPPSQ